MKQKREEIFTDEEFKAWLQLLKKRTIELRKTKKLNRKKSCPTKGYPSYTWLSDIERFEENTTLKSFYLVMKLLKVSGFGYFNAPYLKDSSDE